MRNPTHDDAQREGLVAAAPAYVSAAVDATGLQPGQWIATLDETNNKLYFTAVYSTGAVKHGYVSLS